MAVEPIEIRDGVQIPVMEYARISKDSVETESGDDPDVPGGLIPRYMMAGDWVEYRITVPDEQVGKYNLTMNVARAGTDPGLVGLQVYLDDNLAGQISRAGTGGWKSWVASDPLELDLSAGEHVIRVVYTAQCNMSLLEFTRAIQGDEKIYDRCCELHGFVQRIQHGGSAGPRGGERPYSGRYLQRGLAGIHL